MHGRDGVNAVRVNALAEIISAHVQIFISWAMLWYQLPLVTRAVHDKQETY